MSADKTTPMLGRIIKEPAGRDAVHIAVMPIVAETELHAAAPVGIKNGLASYCAKAVGIVDPFLSHGPAAGERFYLFLFPNTITSLRHQWTHPTIDAPEPVTSEAAKDAARKWLVKFCREWNFFGCNGDDETEYGPRLNDEEIVSRVLVDCQIEEGYLVAMGTDLHHKSELGMDEETFWQHVETLTGFKPTQDWRDKFGWGCSC